MIAAHTGKAGHRNTACKPHTMCGPGTRLGGASSTVGPGTCAPCPAGEFRSDAAHYEPRCILHKKCVEGQNRKATGTATADTQCAENRECTPAEYEAVAPTAGGSDRVCEALATCEAGRYIKTPHTKTKDRVCGYCDGETFYTNQPDLDACKEFRFCSFGEYVATAGTATSDLVCGDCNRTNDEHQSAALGNASDHRATACQVKQRCPPGTFVARDDNTRGRQCEACPTGRHVAEAGHVLDKCLPHADCPAGEQLANASRTTKGSCEACAPGQFRPTTAEPTCRPQTPCQRDTFASSPPGGSMDRVCSPCPKGTSLALDNHTEVACTAPTTAAAATTTAADTSTNATKDGANTSSTEAKSAGSPPTATAPGASTQPSSGPIASTNTSGGDGNDGGGGGGGDGSSTIVVVVVVVVVVLVACAVTRAAVAARRRKNQTDEVLGSLAASRRETLAAAQEPSSSRSGSGRGGGRETVHNNAFDPGAAST